MAQEYQQFASDFTGSLATLQQNTCEDLPIETIPVDIPCPTCTPDPEAVVPDWTTLTDKEPFLNKQTCQYSITITTEYTDVGTNYVSRTKEYAPVAARRLLRYFNKLETDEIVDLLVNGYAGSPPPLEATDWFIPFTPNSNLKLLYTINAFNFDGIASDEEDPQSFSEQIVPSSNEIVLDLSTLQIKLDRITKVLGVYGKFQAALRNIDNGSIVVEGTNKEFIIGSIQNETSLTYAFSIIDKALNRILDDNGYDTFGTFIPSFASWLSEVRKADQIVLGINDKFVIENITIKEEGCPDYKIKETKLDRYIDESPLNNPTIIAYLSRINEMYDEAMAIEAPDWTQFMLEYTYPNITINYGANTIFDDEQSLAECIASAVAEYGNVVSNRLLDSLYKFPDLVADKLNKYACKEDGERDSLTTAQLIAEQKGKMFEKVTKAINDSDVFKTITIISDFKERMAKLKVKNGKASLASLFDDILDDYGFCGLLSLFQALFQCIAGGFSFEEILKKILESSFNNLTPLQMSKFLELLPSDKKVEVINKVDEILTKNDLVSAFFTTFNVASSAAMSGTMSGSNLFGDDKEFEKEKEKIANADITFEQKNAANASAQNATQAATNSASVTQTDIQPKNEFNKILGLTNNSTSNYRQQLGQNKVGDILGQIQKVIMKAYIDALLELVQAEELYSILLKFPGVKIIAQLINAFNCPTPDTDSKITWLNFLNTLEIEWCKLHFDVTLPPLPTLPDLGAFLSTLWKALSQVAKELIIKLIYDIINEILLKLLEILTNSLCSLLDTLSQAAIAALTGGNAANAFLDLLRESFNCPPIESAEQEQALLEAVGQIFGGQGASGFTTQEVASYLQTASTSLTSYELVDLLKGKLSLDKTKYLKEVMRIKEPKMASLFPNEDSISSLFSTLGNLIPDNILQNYEDQATELINLEFPANLSVCGTPESIDIFNTLRESILSDKGLTDEEIRHQIDGIQERSVENLTLLTTLAAKGLGNYAGEKLISAIYGSGTLTSPYSALKQDNCNTSPYGNVYGNQITKQAQTQANNTFFNSIKTIYLNDLFKEPVLFDNAFTGLPPKAPVAFLNAVLSDKNARDFVKHNKRTDDLLFTLYNSEEQEADFPYSLPLAPKQTENNYFPTTIANLTRKSLQDASSEFTNNFTNKTQLYDINIDTDTPKRVLFGKKEDYFITTDATDKAGIGKKFHMLYSQFVIKNNLISSENLNRFAVLTEIDSTEREIEFLPDISLDIADALVKKLRISGSPNIENYNVLFQSRFDLDDDIRTLKDQYLPSLLANSPQADCFISFIDSKMSLGQYSTPITANIDTFNAQSEKCFKFIENTLTSEESYAFGYEYQNEKITQEDIELDPETLERKTNNSRVVFLDYTKYGGTEEQPPVYIKPATRTGWLGVADSIIPEFGCEPKVENIVNFDELNQLMTELQSSLSDDPQLAYSPDCREVVPYLKPLSSLMAANLQVAVVTTMRIYISEAILRCIPLYSKFVVSYGKIIDELYIDYVLQKIETGLLNQGDGILNIKNDRYYLQFLEQCVQVVSRKLLEESITLTDVEQQALDSINNMIRDFYFIKEKDYTKLKETFKILQSLKEAANEFKYSLNYGNEQKVQNKYNSLITELTTYSLNYGEFTRFIEQIQTLYTSYVNNNRSNSIAHNIKTILNEIIRIVSEIQVYYLNKQDQILQNVITKINSEGKYDIPSLVKLRKEMVLEGIRTTKVEAKILMRKILKDEIAAMASNFAAHIYTTPTITNIHKYFLDNDEVMDNETQIIVKAYDKPYFDVAADPSNGDHPLLILNSNENNSFDSLPYYFTLVDNPTGYFFLERYVKLQDRITPISDTTIPEDITNRPENINGAINVYAFKDWISNLSDTTKNTEMYKLFGDLSVTGSSEQGFQITGSTLGIKYGLRLSYVPSNNNINKNYENTSNALVINEKAYLLTQAQVDGTKLTNSQYIIPIINVETDMINDVLSNFDPDSGINQYFHECLVQKMIENSEFKFLFYYCIPLQKYMSAVSSFITETYVKTIGLDDEWVSPPEVTFDEKFLNFYKSKEASQIFFDLFYNWEDTEYKNIVLNKLLEGPDVLMEKVNALLRPVGPLIFTKTRIIPRRPYDEDGVDCDARSE